MTVVAQTGIFQRTWRGYDDPGLPVGMYMSSTSVLGDTSGGSSTIQFIFRAEAAPVTGRFYNIEQLDVNRVGTQQREGFLQSFNFESVGPTGLVNFERRLVLEPNNGTFGSALDHGQLGFRLPLFLGSPQALADLEAQVNIGFNNADGVTILATIQGYIWEPRSIMAEGGLRRPIDSLYGR